MIRCVGATGRTKFAAVQRNRRREWCQRGTTRSAYAHRAVTAGVRLSWGQTGTAPAADRGKLVNQYELVRHWPDVRRMTEDLYAGWRQRRQARVVSRDVLRHYRDLLQDGAVLEPQQGYALAVARHAHASDAEASAVLTAAQESFATWPVERPLRLRDVVQYLVVQQCLIEYGGRSGICAPLTGIVAEEIPANL